MKRISPTILLLGLSLSLALSMPLSVARAADESVDFSADTSFTPVKVPDYFFGVGREQLYGINKPKEAQEMADARVQILRDLKIKVLRGPCGTQANFFLWKKGYYFTSAEPDYEKYFDKTKERESDRALGPGSRALPLSELLEESIALNVPYIFNVNVISQSPEEIADLVREMKKLSPQPIFLEMGNELYEPGDNKTFPQCTDYIAKVREIKQAVNAVDPSAKIGVVCPAYPFSKNRLLRSGLRSAANTGNQGIDRYLEWDQTLAANADAFDAVILHPYIFFRPENATQDSLMAYMFAWNNAGEEALTDYYAKLFPTKKLWITEFNVLTWAQFGEKDPAMKNRIQMMKSPGTALVNLDALLGFIDAGNVEMTSIHTFLDGQGFGVVTRWGTGFEKLPNYYVYEAMGTLLDKFPVYYRLSAMGAPTTDMLMSYSHVSQGPEVAMVRFDNVGAWGFGDGTALRQILFLNRTMIPVKVGLTGKKLARVWTYGGRQAIPEFLNFSREWTAPPAVNPEPDRTAGAPEAQLELPPYSACIANVQP